MAWTPLLTASRAGLSSSTPVEPAAHQDADLWHAGRPTRVPRIVDRKGSEQAWPLLHLACPEDGRVWCFCQRAAGARLDQHPPEAICRPDQPES